MVTLSRMQLGILAVIHNLYPSKHAAQNQLLLMVLLWEEANN